MSITTKKPSMNLYLFRFLAKARAAVSNCTSSKVMAADIRVTRLPWPWIYQLSARDYLATFFAITF